MRRDGLVGVGLQGAAGGYGMATGHWSSYPNSVERDRGITETEDVGHGDVRMRLDDMRDSEDDASSSQSDESAWH